MQPNQVKETLAQIATEAAELKAAVGGALTDTVADWLSPQYAVAAREQLANATSPEERWKILRMVAIDLSALRRGDHCAERLRLERERLELLRAQCQQNKEAEFEEWLKLPAIRERVNPRHRRELVVKRILQVIDHHLTGSPLPEFEYLDDPEPVDSGEVKA